MHDLLLPEQLLGVSIEQQEIEQKRVDTIERLEDDVYFIEKDMTKTGKGCRKRTLLKTLEVVRGDIAVNERALSDAMTKTQIALNVVGDYVTQNLDHYVALALLDANEEGVQIELSTSESSVLVDA